MQDISGFQPSCEVTEPHLLFGHSDTDGLLDGLVTHLRMGTNTQVLGERRSGKTSLLRCCAVCLQQKAPALMPVYLNFRQHYPIQGYADAHRFLMASIHASASNRNWTLVAELAEAAEFSRNGNLFPCHSDTDAYRLVADVPAYRIGGLLEEYLFALSDSGLGVVLLLDEYEHLLRYTLEGKAGAFFFVRDLASRLSRQPGKPKPLTYVVAGKMPWLSLCETLGSPELNNIGTVLQVGPLNPVAFAAMWDHCVETSPGEAQARLAQSEIGAQQAYALSGGWPFFGKVIGETFCAQSASVELLYETLRQHFSVMWSGLLDVERTCLCQAARNGWSEHTPVARDLIRRGLLARTLDEGMVPLGELWARFVQEHSGNNGVHAGMAQRQSPDARSDRLRLLVDDIATMIMEINETSLNTVGYEVFQCSNHDVRTYADLRTPATTEAQFTHFALSLYNLIFERTTGPRLRSGKPRDDSDGAQAPRTYVLERLPKKLRRSSAFVRSVDAVRHHFGKGHNTRLSTFNSSGAGMDVGDVLEQYLGSRAHPREGQFLELQLGMLRDLVTYLGDVRQRLESQA